MPSRSSTSKAGAQTRSVNRLWKSIPSPRPSWECNPAGRCPNRGGKH